MAILALEWMGKNEFTIFRGIAEKISLLPVALPAGDILKCSFVETTLLRHEAIVRLSLGYKDTI
jgi:hypothetical protein